MTGAGDLERPVSKPVHPDAAVGTDSVGAWVRGGLWVLGGCALTGIVWSLTGEDLVYGATVALTATRLCGSAPVPMRRALGGFAFAGCLSLVGAFTLGGVGIGLGVEERLVQGAGGLAVAALSVVAATLAARRTRHSGDH